MLGVNPKCATLANVPPYAHTTSCMLTHACVHACMHLANDLRPNITLHHSPSFASRPFPMTGVGGTHAPTNVQLPPEPKHAYTKNTHMHLHTHIQVCTTHAQNTQQATPVTHPHHRSKTEHQTTVIQHPTNPCPPPFPHRYTTTSGCHNSSAVGGQQSPAGCDVTQRKHCNHPHTTLLLC